MRVLSKLGEIILILLLGAGLRFAALTDDVRFHPDEALFATFARNAAVHGDWMFSGALDKPPLSLYAAALLMQFTGVYVNDLGVLDLGLKAGEFSARLPNVFAGIVLIALTYALTKVLCRIWGTDNAGVVPTHLTRPRITPLLNGDQSKFAANSAALLVALSPFMVGFSGTAFTDVLMVTLMVGALVAAVRGQGIWAGICLGLSFWTKQQAVFYLPLILCFLRFSRINLLKFAVSLVVLVGVLLLWDAARGQTSIFALAAANNNPERTLVRFDELLPRLYVWLNYLVGFFCAGWLVCLLIIRRKGTVLLIYCAGYLLLHWIGAFNTYDRYLLPILPLAAVLIGINIRRSGIVYPLLAVLILLSTPLRFPTDTRPRDDAMITLADYLNAKPLGAIIYDHWLGWEMGYYIGAWSDKRQVYYPEPNILAEDALLNPDTAPRYFIAPIQQGVQAWLSALRANGFTVEQEFSNQRYVVYRITPPTRT